MSYQFCHRILEGLWAAGVRDMVVTPGSRSTPLLLAALDSDFTLHSCIDERSAAFFALGRARARGTRVALLCTSGSAGAHYLPALLEARYAGHCLVALTADRPPELQGTGANQTIDQQQLFASACPPCLEVGVPQADPALALEARRRVHETVALATGPIHINLAFRKPLEPTETERRARLETPPMPALSPASVSVPDTTLEELSATCQRAERGVIVAGPAASANLGPALCALATRLGFALLAEATSGARLRGEPHSNRFDGFNHILQAKGRADALQPDLILQFGADPASGPLGRWLENTTATRIRFTDQRELRDATGTTRMIVGAAAEACEALMARCDGPAESVYLDAWRDADRASWAAVATTLSKKDSSAVGEAFAVAKVLDSLPSGCQLTLGNSLPIRSADSVLPGHRARLQVLHQRGTSGIEGLIAGAIGGSSKAASALLLGDVSCAHDLSSLALHRSAEGPLAIVVIDNGGGKIFSHLPVAALPMPAEHWDLWQTPPHVDFEWVCRGYGVSFRRCSNPDTLESDLAWAHSQSAVCMLQIVVAPDSMRDFLSAVQGALA